MKNLLSLCQAKEDLKIVQQGVHAEIAVGIQRRYVDHVSLVLRMETPIERRMLLGKLIDAMPTLDVRPFVQTVENVAGGALGESANDEFQDDASMNGVQNLGRNDQ